MTFALRLSWVEIKRQLILARHYPFQEISGLLVFYIFFIGLYWGWAGSKVQEPFNHSYSNHLVLGYLLWTYAVAAVSLLAFDIAEEAQSGTLEQLALVPHQLRPWLLRCFGNFVLQSGRATILYCLIILTTNEQLLSLTGLQAAVAALTILGLYGMGLVVGAVTLLCKKTTQLVNIVHFFLFFFTGITIPIDVLPRWLYSIAQIIPLTHGMALLRQLASAKPMEPVGGQSFMWLGITSTVWIVSGITALLVAYRLARLNGLFHKF